MFGFDVVVVGSGMGGATLAHALTLAGGRVCIVERGNAISSGAQNWDPGFVLEQGGYTDGDEQWETPAGEYNPAGVYCVGGMTKVFGGVLMRLREADFAERELDEEKFPSWPISYLELERHYTAAENLFGVHGMRGEDPSEPPCSKPFPMPPVPHEPYIADLVGQLGGVGMKPFHLPLGIDFSPGGKCVRCSTCEQFPCRVHAKADAEAVCIRPAQARGLTLMPNTRCQRILFSDSAPRVLGIETDGPIIWADAVILAAGAVHSPAIVFRSVGEDKRLEQAVGTSVGRYIMEKNITLLSALNLKRRNPTVFQKTWGVNDYYLSDGHQGTGAIQAAGKFGPSHVVAYTGRRHLGRLMSYSTELAVATECAPRRTNRVLMRTGSVRVEFRPNNLRAHRALVQRTQVALAAVGYPRVAVASSRILQSEDWTAIAPCNHVVGSLRMGNDETTSVLNPRGRFHNIENLYCADASSFPRQGSANPGLTIAALALRLGEWLSRGS